MISKLGTVFGALSVLFIGTIGVVSWVITLWDMVVWYRGLSWMTMAASWFCMVLVVLWGVGYSARKHQRTEQDTGMTVGEVIGTLVDEPGEDWVAPTGDWTWPSLETFPKAFPDTHVVWPEHVNPWTPDMPLTPDQLKGMTVSDIIASLFNDAAGGAPVPDSDVGSPCFVEAFPASTKTPWLRMEFRELLNGDDPWVMCVVHSIVDGEVVSVVRPHTPSPGLRLLTHAQLEVARNHGFDPDRLGYTPEGRLVLAAAFTKPE